MVCEIPTEAVSTYTRSAALTVLTFAAESRVSTDARRRKIKFVNLPTNSAAQSDVSSPVAASSRDTAVEGPPCIKTVEDHFTHGLLCAISDCSGTSLRKSKSGHLIFQIRPLSPETGQHPGRLKEPFRQPRTRRNAVPAVNAPSAPCFAFTPLNAAFRASASRVQSPPGRYHGFLPVLRRQPAAAPHTGPPANTGWCE